MKKCLLHVGKETEPDLALLKPNQKYNTKSSWEIEFQYHTVYVKYMNLAIMTSDDLYVHIMRMREMKSGTLEEWWEVIKSIRNFVVEFT